MSTPDERGPRRVTRADAFPEPLPTLPPETGVGEALKSFGCSFALGLVLIVFLLPTFTHSHCCGETRTSALRKAEIRAELKRAAEQDGG